MIALTFEKLASIISTSSQLRAIDSTAKFTGITTDTRNIQPGSCFIAIKGENFDGNDYVDVALENGAACAIASTYDPNTDKPVLLVDDTIKALGQLALWYRNQLAAKVVAITGSVGKTTTRRMIHHVLSQHFKCHQSPKSFNNNIGLPITLLSASADTEVIIAELGSNAPGEIDYLTTLASPDVAIVTNVHGVHLEGFGTISNVIKEKSSIATGLTPDGKFLINADFPELVNFCKEHHGKFLTFGFAADCDIPACDPDFDARQSSMIVDGCKVTVPMPGRAAVLNALASWAVCKQFAMTIEQFTAGIATFQSISMRMQVETYQKDNGQAITVINDCYNANPASMANALEYLGRMAKDSKGSRAVLVCGTMGELGADSQSLHTEIGTVAAEAGVDLILATGKFVDSLTEAAVEKSNGTVNTHIFKNTDTLCNKLHDFITADDIVLVKGSRVAKLELAVQELRSLFSQ